MARPAWINITALVSAPLGLMSISGSTWKLITGFAVSMQYTVLKYLENTIQKWFGKDTDIFVIVEDYQETIKTLMELPHWFRRFYVFSALLGYIIGLLYLAAAIALWERKRIGLPIFLVAAWSRVIVSALTVLTALAVSDTLGALKMWINLPVIAINLIVLWYVSDKDPKQIDEDIFKANG